MFYQLIQHKRDEWYASPDSTVGELIAYIIRRGMMRDAQIEAIMTYLGTHSLSKYDDSTTTGIN